MSEQEQQEQTQEDDCRLRGLEGQLGRADAVLDAAGITPTLLIDERVKKLVEQRDRWSEELEEARVETRRVRTRYNTVVGNLRQLKQDLLAMGRIQKLSCDLVLGDADPEDVGSAD